MHKLQTFRSMCFGTYVPSSGSSETKFKTCWYRTDHIHNTAFSS